MMRIFSIYDHTTEEYLVRCALATYGEMWSVVRQYRYTDRVVQLIFRCSNFTDIDEHICYHNMDSFKPNLEEEVSI